MTWRPGGSGWDLWEIRLVAQSAKIGSLVTAVYVLFPSAWASVEDVS